MKSARLALLAILFTAGAANAQGGPSDRGAPPSVVGRYSATSRQSLGQAPSGERIIRNANDCAPDKATPVWGADSSLIGYSCAPYSANGS
ncbi:MAG TPA: hypothetical protein VKU03_07560 [Roseiarcus sp.]|nr:hypothetical protein [Roseiarcus sp.]